MADSNAWTDEWLKAQQKFVQSWSEMSKDWGKADTDSQGDLWANGLEMWRKTYPFPYPAQPQADDVINKLTDIGKGYFSMAEQIGRKVGAGGKPDQVIHQWLEQLKSSLQQQLDHWSPLQHQATEDLLSPWMSPVAGWQKIAAAMMPFQVSDSGPVGWGIGAEFDELDRALSMPGLGFFRESQEKQQKGIRLAMDYRQANQNFNQAFIRVTIESLQMLQQRLAEMKDDDGVDEALSLRRLYDLWVDTSESCYADFAMSEEYQSLYGDMVNRLMLLKKHYGEVVDEAMGRLNLPTRREIDTMQQRLQETRRENRLLRRELKEIREMLGASAAPAPSKKKPAAKKAASRKAAATSGAGNKAGARS